MPIISKQLEFSSAQAITAAAASTNKVKYTAGKIEGLKLRLASIGVLNPTTSLTIALRTDDNEAFSSPTTLVERTILAAALANLEDKLIPFPIEGLESEGYLDLYFTPNGGDATTGAIDAHLVRSIESNQV